MAMSEADRTKLRRNQVAIKEDIEMSDIFFSVLIQENILTTDMKERIEAKVIRKEMAGELLSMLPRRGKNALEVFIKALCVSGQEDLAERLDPDLYAKHRTSIITRETEEVVEIHKDYSTTILQQIESIEFQVLVKPMLTELRQSLSSKSNLTYSISEQIGRALIIGNEKDDQRNLGIEADVITLKSLFQQLHFEVDVKLDLTASEILSVLKLEAQHIQHQDSSAFVLCILNYGCKHNEIFDKDRKTIKLQDIISHFDGKNCSALRGKPKLYFIHTGETAVDENCSDRAELMETEGVHETDGPLILVGDSQSDSIVVHEKADVLQILSTSDLWRCKDKGSWYIRCLSAVISYNASMKHLEDMIAEVNAIMKQIKLQIPEKRTTLRKQFFFMP